MKGPADYVECAGFEICQSCAVLDLTFVFDSCLWSELLRVRVEHVARCVIEENWVNELQQGTIQGGAE